jgi:xanthine dehydrogenase accessory factor
VEIDLSTAPEPWDKAYLEFIKPRPHLVIAGGGHIGKALAHLGSLLAFEVSVVDDRPEFASESHIPDADHFLVKDIGSAMKEIETGPDTYIVIVTRGHTHDGEALKACVGSAAAYIGMIGSSHKIGIMRKQFIEEQWATPEQWDSIYAPIGLDIGSKTVEEIAVSIAAQLVEVRNKQILTHA